MLLGPGCTLQNLMNHQMAGSKSRDGGNRKGKEMNHRHTQRLLISTPHHRKRQKHHPLQLLLVHPRCTVLLFALLVPSVFAQTPLPLLSNPGKCPGLLAIGGGTYYPIAYAGAVEYYMKCAAFPNGGWMYWNITAPANSSIAYITATFENRPERAYGWVGWGFAPWHSMIGSNVVLGYGNPLEASFSTVTSLLLARYSADSFLQSDGRWNYTAEPSVDIQSYGERILIKSFFTLSDWRKPHSILIAKGPGYNFTSMLLEPHSLSLPMANKLVSVNFGSGRTRVLPDHYKKAPSPVVPPLHAPSAASPHTSSPYAHTPGVPKAHSPSAHTPVPPNTPSMQSTPGEYIPLAAKPPGAAGPGTPMARPASAPKPVASSASASPPHHSPTTHQIPRSTPLPPTASAIAPGTPKSEPPSTLSTSATQPGSAPQLVQERIPGPHPAIPLGSGTPAAPSANTSLPPVSSSSTETTSAPAGVITLVSPPPPLLLLPTGKPPPPKTYRAYPRQATNGGAKAFCPSRGSLQKLIVTALILIILAW